MYPQKKTLPPLKLTLLCQQGVQPGRSMSDPKSMPISAVVTANSSVSNERPPLAFFSRRQQLNTIREPNVTNRPADIYRGLSSRSRSK